MTSPEHLDKAQQNESFATSLGLSSGVHIDWAITVLFYAALHYVQAYFVTQGQVPHMHKTRDSAIGLDPNISGIYSDYRDLEDLSREARYESPVGRLTRQEVSDMRARLGNVKAVIKPLL